jgi:hypothetical protein
MQFTENVQANWQEEYCFIMTMPDPIQPKQPKRIQELQWELPELLPSTQTWFLVTSICFVC